MWTFDDAAVQAAYERYLAARVEVYGEEKAAKRPQTLMDIATIGAKILKKRGLLAEAGRERGDQRLLHPRSPPRWTARPRTGC